jgi:hypothetical protein
LLKLKLKSVVIIVALLEIMWLASNRGRPRKVAPWANKIHGASSPRSTNFAALTVFTLSDDWSKSLNHGGDDKFVIILLLYVALWSSLRPFTCWLSLWLSCHDKTDDYGRRIRNLAIVIKNQTGRLFGTEEKYESLQSS